MLEVSERGWEAGTDEHLGHAQPQNSHKFHINFEKFPKIPRRFFGIIQNEDNSISNLGTYSKIQNIQLLIAILFLFVSDHKLRTGKDFENFVNDQKFH